MLEKLADMGQDLRIGGDLNIDRWCPNHPESGSDIKLMIPIFEDF